MPSNTRDLAAETLLLMVSATLLFMGGAGLLVGLVLPKMLLGPMLFGGRRWQFTMALVMADHRGWAPAFWRLCAGPALAKR